MEKQSSKYNFTVYSEGLVYASVCTNLPKDEVAKHMGEHSPSGVGSWEIAEDEYFSDGVIKNGSACPDTEGNRHWLMVC